ncbi:alanine/glycine:cation symporter family protein [Scatolibacter rhodanostii]|uniref:alanine/glycine:cation symporter family protein n=1 Tax=Scatolibacter rhodanostii TaxID=2014781 RepID=UPI000C08C4C3|nr:amino acid carrier protein [Scatolibacter rhodanostii]
MRNILQTISNMLWGWHVLIPILIVGIWLSLKSKFFQIRKSKFWMKTALFGSKSEKGKISSFQALTAALGGSIGTGNIVGVAVAVGTGGPGAILWMCISALFGMMTLFAENMLAAKYPQKKGPLGYIERVKKIGKPLAALYAVGCFLSSLAMGNMVQVNAAASAFSEFGISPEMSGFILAAVLFFVAVGGMQFAVKITEKLVPLMTVIFFSAAVVVLWVFRANIPSAITSIFEGAFSLRAGLGGAAGMILAAKTGISRGVFTNEAGLGSASFAYDEVESLTPVQKGCLGIFQVFADTVVMCTITGLCILSAQAPLNLEGAAISFFPFEAAMGEWGAKLISFCTALFAVATTITWCCYGREGLFYLTKGKGKTTFAVVYAFCAFLGCVVPLDFAFQLGDSFNGLMAIPNIIALFCFGSEVMTVIRDKDRKVRLREKTKKASKLIKSKSRQK